MFIPTTQIRTFFKNSQFTFSISAASFLRCAMSSDSVRRSSSKDDLYSCPTNSLWRVSFTWLTKKCITAFGTLQNNQIIHLFENKNLNFKNYIYFRNDSEIIQQYSSLIYIHNTNLSWIFFLTIRKYDLMSRSITSQSRCSRADSFRATGTG